MSSTRGVVVKARPRVCLHDVPTSITVSGLTPHTPTTITMITHNDQGKKFSTLAQFVSDANGKVDLNRSESVGGSFTGVFPMGLFSTIKEFPFTAERLQKLDSTKPWKMIVGVYEGHLTMEECEAGQKEVLASTELVRRVMGPGVRRNIVHHGRVRGVLFLPPGPGPFPAVIDVSGGSGGLKEYRPAMLASRGFATLALAYFKYEDLPESYKNLDLDYFEEAVEYILNQPEVIPDRCAVVSSSKGSEFALAMGIHIDKVKAVVCFGGMLVPIGTTLTYKGHQLWKGVDMQMLMTMDHKKRIILNESKAQEIFRHDNPDMVPCETAPDDTSFLLAGGDQDTTYAWLSIAALAERMKRHGRETQCRTIIYPGVGHILEPPYSTSSDHSKYTADPKSTGEILEGMKEMIMYWGGEPRGACHAQEDYWRQLQQFLNLHARDLSAWYQEYLQCVPHNQTEQKK